MDWTDLQQADSWQLHDACICRARRRRNLIACSGTRTVGAELVRALWTSPLEHTWSELEFSPVQSSPVQFICCEQTCTRMEWTALRVRRVGYQVVPRKYLDDPSRSSRNDKALTSAFQSLPRPVGFTWKSLYESGSPSPLEGCVVRGGVHPGCSGCLPFVSPHLLPDVQLLAAPTSRRWD